LENQDTTVGRRGIENSIAYKWKINLLTFLTTINEEIYSFFGMSKKAFKMATKLYKQQKVQFTKPVLSWLGIDAPICVCRCFKMKT